MAVCLSLEDALNLLDLHISDTTVWFQWLEDAAEACTVLDHLSRTRECEQLVLLDSSLARSKSKHGVLLW